MKAFLRGFAYAFCGMIHCIKNERNMRIHTVAAIYVLIFARFFAFSRVEWVLLLLTIGGVMSAEAFNTAIERLADRISSERHPLLRQAKDTAAGGVLILALFAAAIAVFLFGNAEGWQKAYEYFSGNYAALAGLAALTICSALFVIVLPYENKKGKDGGKRDGE